MKYFSLFFPGFFLLTAVFLLGQGLVPPLACADKNVTILFLGDSISAGFGVEPQQAYPALIQEMLEKKGVGVNITNASISGSTTAGALSRLKWFLKAKPDIMVLALGANDGLRGLSTDEMSKNLEQTILLAKNNGIKVILAGMKLPPNYGLEYAKAFQGVFDFLAEKHRIGFIPFLLKDVAGDSLLNQADGIHPNQEGHRIIAANVITYIMAQL